MGAGTGDDRIVIDSTGISIYQGAQLIIQLALNGPGGVGPTLLVQDVTGDQLQIGLGLTGIPGEFYKIGGNNGLASIGFNEWMADRDQFAFGMTGEAGDSTLIALREDAAGFGEIVVSQEIVSFDPAGGTASETWHNIAYNAGLAVPWTNVGAPYDPVSYRLMPDGTVLWRGLANVGTRAAGSVIFTIPAGYRPATDKFMSVSSNAAAAESPTINIVAATGQVGIFRLPTATAVGFEGVRYPLGII